MTLSPRDEAIIAAALAEAIRNEAARQRSRAAAMKEPLRRQWARRRVDVPLHGHADRRTPRAA